MATLKDLLVSGPARVVGNITGKSFIKDGGTSSQFLKADGSVDANAYSTTSHTHSTSIATSSGTNQITLAFGTKYAITAGGTSYVFTMPGNPNTNTTYTIATGDAKGQIKVTPSSGNAYNVDVNGLGSAAFESTSSFATSSHTHTTSIATSSGTNQITLAFGTKYAITAGGTSYVFTMPSNPNTNTTYTIATGDSNGQIKVTPSSGDAYNVNVKGLGSAAYTASTAYAAASHSHSYLPLAGGEMTGSLQRKYAAASENPVIDVASANQDVWIWRVSDSDYSTDGYGFGIKYLGTGSGNNNDLVLYADNQTSSPKEAYRVHQDGSIVFTSTPKVGSTNVSLEGHTHNYAASNHNHSGVYKPVQTAVSDPSASATTSTTFIDSISQDTNGVITATKKTLPTYASTSHTHSFITTAGDNRAIATKPNDYVNRLIFQGLKNNSTIGSPHSDSYSYVVGLRGWSDSSGGDAHELAFNTGGIFVRQGATTSWGNWNRILTSGDVGSTVAAYSHTHNYAASNHNHSGVYKPVQTAVSDPTASATTSTTFIDTISQDTNGVITVTKKTLPAYASSSHNHDSTYKKKQTAVTDPAVDMNTATAFIDTITQNEQGVITATKKSLPTASSSVAGIMKLGASGGAAAYGHSHSFSEISSRGEAYLDWGGKNHSGAYGPIDAAMVGKLGANRTAFTPASAITVQYSRNGGSTWTDYGASNLQKIGFFTNFNSGGFVIGKSSTASGNQPNASCLLRVILKTDGVLYTVLNKFVIYCSTSGSSGTYCKIDARLQSNVASNTDTWTVFANNVGISGWSGYNVINTSGLTTYGNTAASQYGEVRFTFGCTGSSTSYAGLTVSGINCYGGVGWTVPSTMAGMDSLFTYDMGQNATFPAGITATSFVKSGGTSSQFLKANGSVDSTSYLPLTGGTVTGNITMDGANLKWANNTALPVNSSPQYILCIDAFASGGTTKYTNLSDLKTALGSMTPASHTHGNIQNGGTLQTNDITIANGDKLVVTDSSDSSKIARTSIAFDGSTTSQVLSKKGTWVSLPTNTDELVKQEPDTTNTWRSILVGENGYQTYNANTTSVTGKAYVAKNVSVNPSNGYLHACGFCVNDATGFLTADGGVDGSTYALSNHTHSGYAASSHSHGNVTSGGALQTNDITIANGDKLVVTDSSDSSKIARTSISFDASTTSKYLSKKGTWEDIPSSLTPASHTHGNIQNGGTLQTNDITIANNDKLVVTDSSDSSKIARTSIAFDGSTTSQVLSKKGTWVSLPTNTDEKVLQKVDTASNSLWRPILLGFNGVEDTTMFSDVTNSVWSNQKIGFNVSTGYIKVSGGYVVDGQSGFLKADGGIDSNTYALSNHSHSGYAASSHTHGNIQNGGTLQTNDITIANGDKLVVTDSSDSSKIARTSITFDGSTTTQYLSKKGTFENAPSCKVVAGDTAQQTHNQTANGSVFINTIYGGHVSNSLEFKGAGSMVISSDDGGVVTFECSGGGGQGGDTVVGKTVTLSTSAQAVITRNGSDSGSVKLDSNPPSGWLGTSNTKAAAGNHGHGNIANGGQVSTVTTATSGDRILIADSSSHYDVTGGPQFASDSTKFLCNDGTWRVPAGGGGGSAAMAVDEYTGINSGGSAGTLGTVLPIDHYNGVVWTAKNYEPDPEVGYIPCVTPDQEQKILYALPVGMDDEGHLFIPVTEKFLQFLSEGLGYELGEGKPREK